MKNLKVTIDLSSMFGECHQIEQALCDLLTLNPLLPTREGTAIDIRVETIDTIEQSSDEDEKISSGIKDEPTKIKKNHWDSQ